MLDQFSRLGSMTLTRFLFHLHIRSGMIMHVKEQLARNSIQKRSAAWSSPLIFSISHLFRNWCGVPPGLSLYDVQHLLHGTCCSDSSGDSLLSRNRYISLTLLIFAFLADSFLLLRLMSNLKDSKTRPAQETPCTN